MNPYTYPQKANLDTFFGLSAKVVEGIEKLAGLNLQAMRSTLGESQENVLKALSTREPRDLTTLQTALAAPIPERIQSYNRQLFERPTSAYKRSSRTLRRVRRPDPNLRLLRGSRPSPRPTHCSKRSRRATSKPRK